MRKVILITAAVLVVYCILAWFTGTWIGLQGSKFWMLTGALWALGLAAAGVVIWFFWNKKKQEEAAEFEEPSAGDDLDLLVRDAENRLSASGAAKGSIGSLPVVFVMGDTGVAKTSTVVHSGLEPELLAGQVYHDADLIPTPSVNIWFAQRTILVEGAGRLIGEQGTWGKLARKLQPGRLRAAVGSGAQAPRAALVLVEAEAFLQPGASQNLAAMARTLRARLGEISQSLGINLPVYLLLTKLDRVPFFADYVRNLTNEEAAQVLGVTVSMADTGGGVYAEREASRLNGVFEQLFRSLCSARPWFLSREHDAPKLPGVYEFPREFRKIRANLVQFLVELCRPSQLTVGPFLRGFYFSGVRPVVVTEMAPAPAARPASASPRDASLHATGIFRADAVSSAPAASAPKVVGTRRVPQWVFLSHLFHHVLLADAAARGASGASVKTSMLRRVLLASAAGLSLLYATALIVSYSKNRGLENTALSAARALDGAQPDPVKLASLDSLQRLETLRQSLATLTEYRRHGAPLGYRWGLYAGNDMYPEVRRLYFDGFNKVLLAQTQDAMVKSMAGLPATPGPEFSPVYDTLKAYLMTTSHPDKTTKEFLSPVLQDRWAGGRTIDPERAALAQKQFDFYADELKIENPYSSQNDAQTVAKARRYLNQFAGAERVYAAMLADASKGNPPLNFNRKYPGSASAVLETFEVPGAFTKPGWDLMQKALNNPEKYFTGEQWVLGDQGGASFDPSTIGKQLTERYHSDFVRNWLNYMRGGSVVKYANISDAAAKLNVLSGNQSPLLALIWEASQNTNVDLPAAKIAFQPAQAVIPAGTDLFIGNENKAYVNALLVLQASVEAAAGSKVVDDIVAKPTLDNAQAARMTVRQLAQTFRSDPNRVDGTVQKLLEDPILHVEALLKSLGPAALNAAGSAVCGEFRKLWSKYPFNPKPNAPHATLAEVNGLLRKPDGALWKFYGDNLQKLLPKQGAQYVPADGAGLTQAFVGFFNRVAAFSEAIYPDGAQDPMFKYALRPVPMEGIQGIGLNVDGQTLSYSGGNAAPKQFVWQGSGAHGTSASVRLGGGSEFNWYQKDGLWSAFEFFGAVETSRPAGSGHVLEWFLRVGNQPPMTDAKTGQPLTYRLELDMLGGPPVFQKDYFSRFGCVANVAN